MTNESPIDRTPLDAPRRATLLERLKWPLIVVATLLTLYAVSPYYSFWRFTEALKAGDQKRFESMVDFRAVRESLKKQLRARLAESRANQPKREKSLLGLSDQFAPRLIDTLVDAYVTPGGLAALLADKNAARAAVADPNALPAGAGGSAAIAQSAEVRDKLGFSAVRYAFFTGARDFLIDVDGTKLRFRFSKFRWTLKAVEPELGEIQL